jgi:hypothetical protein
MKEPKKPRGHRPLTLRQQAFAEQVALAERSPLEIFRQLYPSRSGTRKKSTERSEAFKMLRTPSMQKAIDDCKTRLALADPQAQIETAKEIIHGVALGKIDPRRYRAAAAMLRLAQKQVRLAEREQVRAERMALETALAQLAAIDLIQELASPPVPPVRAVPVPVLDRDEGTSTAPSEHAAEIARVVADRQQKRDPPATEAPHKQRRRFVNFGDPRLAGDWDLPTVSSRQRREPRHYY